ncbi:hypothetical protein [Streptomyces sp. NPDC047079]|uniref:hypothetical protein n=1 Tax=Streptomyces sp. NPDC047079 TaxID=3154607 RepID=UPI0033E11DF8
MTTDTATGETTPTEPGPTGPLWCRPAGRHRKPRPRRAALAVGGFALAAGALSLVHLAPETVTGGGGTAEAEPRIDATDTAATVGTAPRGSADHPSTTTVIRVPGASPAATAATRPSAQPSSSAGRAAGATNPPTGIPEAPSTPTAPRPPGSPAAPSPTAPRPAPSTSAPAPTPTPIPSTPGLCVPIVGLCVNGLPALGG